MNQSPDDGLLDRWDEYVQANTPSQVRDLTLTMVFLTAGFQVATGWLTGAPALDGTAGFLTPWAYLLLAVPLQAALARHIRTAKVRQTPTLHWSVTIVQMLWLMSLAWYSELTLWILFGTVVVFASISDTRYFYDAKALRINYAATWLIFDLTLLFFDAIGLPGILHRYQTDHDYVIAALFYQLLVAALQQVILVATGRHWRTLDEAVEARSHIETQLAVAERERQVISRTCSLLEPGLSAAQFSHDVSTPISTIASCTAELRSVCDHLDPSERATTQEVLDDLQSAQEELFLLTTSLVRSVRGGTSEPTPVRTMVEEAVRTATHKVRDAHPPELRLEPGTVLAREHHTAVVANLLANGMRERPERPIEMDGRILDGGWYLLSLRDHGVIAAKRDAALERVRASLDLTPADPSAAQRAGRPVEGYGLALVLAKVHLVRHGGWLDVRAPPHGDGLTFDLLLPTPEHDLRDPLDVLLAVTREAA